MANKDFSDSEELKESDDKRLKQKTFRKLIEENVTPEYFKYPGDLVKKVKMSLANNLKNGVRLSLKEGSYDVQITTTKGTETYEENVKGGVLYFPVQDSDTLVKRIVIIDNSTLKEHVYDFTDGTIPFEVTVRNPRFVEVGHYEKALQLDSTTTNYLLNSDSPESQSHALAEGEYILWIKGEGKVVVSASVSGEATEKKPFRFKLYERGPIYLKVVGKVDRFQLEQGTVATAFISTENATVTRIGSQLAISAENL